MRCVQCGDIIDDTILRNRYAHAQILNELHTRRSLRVQSDESLDIQTELSAIGH